MALHCPFIPQIIKSGLMSKEDFHEAGSKALSLFAYGQVANRHIFQRHYDLISVANTAKKWFTNLL
jgi:hypothetical protein